MGDMIPISLFPASSAQKDGTKIIGNRYHVPHLVLLIGAAVGIVLIGAAACAKKAAPPAPVSRGYAIPLVDLAADAARQVVVDREPGQYLGHPTTVLLEDGRTMIAVYPKGHGRGPIQMKRSRDGGLTWSERLPGPENWATSLETPTIHRVVGPDGKKRLIVWSGLYPARLSVSEDDGATWTPLAPAGDWGGIVVMSALVEIKPFGSGRYMAMFHDDGRFFAKEPRRAGPGRVHALQDLLGGRRPDLVLPGGGLSRRARSISASRGSSARPTAGPWRRSCARTAGRATRSSSSPRTRARRGANRASFRERSPATGTPGDTPRTGGSSCRSGT